MTRVLPRPLQGRRWVTIAGCVLVVALSVVPAVLSHPRPNYDSSRYLASPSLGSGQLPVVPILFAVVGHHWAAIAVMQGLIGGACWCFLVYEVARAGHWAASGLGVAAVVLVSCSTYVVQWYAALLSDSLSISLLALTVALGARWVRTGGALWPLVVVAALWALTRSTNAYVLLAGGLLLVPVMAVRYRRWAPQLACVIAISAAATFLSGQGQLWQQPFFHSLTERILPSPSFRAWFAGRHMPGGPALDALAGPYYGYKDVALTQSPKLAGFRSWLDHSGKLSYTEFLVSHVGWVLRGTFSRHEELRPGLISYYGGGVSRPWYPGPLRNVFLSERQPEILIALSVDVVVLAIVGSRRRLRRIAVAVGVWSYVAALGLLTLALDWAGDSWEVGRHSVDGTIAVALAAIMLVASCPPTGAGARPRSSAEQPPRREADSCPPSDRVPS